MPIESKLTAEQCEKIAGKIINHFNTDPAGDGGRQYGCDWPTMRMMYPAKCGVFSRLRLRWKALTAAKK